MFLDKTLQPSFSSLLDKDWKNFPQTLWWNSRRVWWVCHWFVGQRSKDIWWYMCLLPEKEKYSTFIHTYIFVFEKKYICIHNPITLNGVLRTFEKSQLIYLLPEQSRGIACFAARCSWFFLSKFHWNWHGNFEFHNVSGGKGSWSCEFCQRFFCRTIIQLSIQKKLRLGKTVGREDLSSKKVLKTETVYTCLKKRYVLSRAGSSYDTTYVHKCWKIGELD